MVSTALPSPSTRSGSRIAWLVVGGLLAVTAVVWGTLNLIDLLAHERSHAVTTVSQAVQIVDVSNAAGSVSIEGSSGTAVTVDAAISRGLGQPSHRVEVQGNRLVVRASCPAVVNTFCQVNYRIAVPAGTDVVVRASGGGVNATGLLADRVDVSSSGGGVHLAFAGPPAAVVASSSGGGVTVEVPETPGSYRIVARSSGGPVHRSVPSDPASNRTIRATSSGGGVTVRYLRTATG